MRRAYPDAVLIPEGDTEPGRHRRAARLRRRLLPGHPRGARGAVQQRRRRHAAVAARRTEQLLLRRRRRRRPSTLGRFLAVWDEHRAAAGPDRPVVLATADHDFSRLRCGDRDAASSSARVRVPAHLGQRPVASTTATRSACATCRACPTSRAASATPATTGPAAAPRCSGTTPCQRRLLRPPSPTGSTCRRTPTPHRPTVAAQRADPDSTLHLVRRLIALRRAHPALGAGSDRGRSSRGYPFAYLRGEHAPRRGQPAPRARLDRGIELAGRAPERLDGSGVEAGDGRISADGFGWGIFTLS